MDDRPIKGNPNGQYNMNFIDPSNDLCAYYNGIMELQDLVEQYLQTATFYSSTGTVQLGESKLYGEKVKEQHYMDHCSVCLNKFQEGQEVKLLPCKHCFHKQCATPWFKENNHCPNCRYVLPISKEEQWQPQK